MAITSPFGRVNFESDALGQFLTDFDENWTEDLGFDGTLISILFWVRFPIFIFSRGHPNV